MTIKEIAQLAGVSPSTVSKIINDKDDSINPETRSRVLTIVKKYNYVPYANIKAATPTKTFIIGVLRRYDNGQDRLICGILETAQAQGYNILLLDSAHSYDEELKHITALCRSNVDGLIWEPVGINSLQSGHYLTEANIPVCYINTPHVPSACNIDFRNMGYLLAKEMINHGHRNIACLLEKNSLYSQVILEGIQKCLYDYHITLPNKMCFYSSNKEDFQELLGGQYSAVISSSYSVALKFYHRLVSMNYQIPEDISLCSLRDDRLHESEFPAISTMEIPYRALGSYAAKAIIQNIEKDTTVNPNDFSGPYQISAWDTIKAPHTFRNRRLLIVGSIYMDILLIVRELPKPGETTFVLNTISQPGGSGILQSINTARLGCEVALIGKVGKENDAHLIFDLLQKEHITSTGISCTSDVSTGKVYTYTNSINEIRTVFNGANEYLSITDIKQQEHLFKSSRIALISSAGISKEAIREALNLSKSYNLLTIFNSDGLNSISPEFISYIDILISSRDEATRICSGETDFKKQAELLYSMGISTIIIYLDSEGVFLKSGNTEVHFPPLQSMKTLSEKIDTFISTFAAYLLNNYSLEQAIQIAEYASSFYLNNQNIYGYSIDKVSLESNIAIYEPDLIKNV